MGVAVLEQTRLIHQGVQRLGAMGPPSLRLDEVRQAVSSLIREFRPDVVAIERPFFAPDNNAALLNLIADEIRVLAMRHRIEVRSSAPSTIRKHLCGDGRATKREVALAVASRFPELRKYLRSRSSWWRRYYGNMFDAVAVGIVAGMAPGRHGRKTRKRDRRATAALSCRSG